MTSTYHHPTYADGEPTLIGHHVEITTGQMEGTIGVVTGIEEGWLLLDNDGEVVRTDASCVERYWPPVKLDTVIHRDLAERLTMGFIADLGVAKHWSMGFGARQEIADDVAALMAILAPAIKAALEDDQ